MSSSISYFIQILCSKASSTSTKEVEPKNITTDEQHILDYIGGFILRKLRRRANDDQKDILDILESTDTCAAKDSLITTLNYEEYGMLLKPSSLFTKILCAMENCFRKQNNYNRMIEAALENLDLNEIK